MILDVYSRRPKHRCLNGQKSVRHLQKKQNAKLVFVNSTSCGLEYPDGTHQHVTIQGMADFLEEHE